jgi:hypothetical protein
MRPTIHRSRPSIVGILLPACIILLLVFPFLAGCTQPVLAPTGIEVTQPAPSSPQEPSGQTLWTSPDDGLLGRDLNDTASLLTLSIGGFEGGRAWVSSYYPSSVVNYSLVTRNITPTTVEFRVFPVKSARSSIPHDPYEGLEVTIVPEKINVEPGRSYTAQFRVNLTSDRYDETLKLLPYFIQAKAENDNRIIADDWVIVYAGGATVPGVSGFYRGHTFLDDEDHEISVRAGETGTVTYLHQPGIGGTGFVRYNLSLVSGTLNMMPMPPEEKRPFPQGMQVSISPNNYMARSFGNYPSTMLVKTETGLPPGDYHVLIEADGLGTNTLCLVHVVPA